MLAEGLRAGGIGDDRITVIVDEQQAIEAALRMARAGDLLLIFADALARGWKQITNFRPDASALVVPAPRAARSVPRQAVLEEGPADDTEPARMSTAPVTAPIVSTPPARWNVASDDIILMRDERGVILAPEAGD
jgi:cyanophycin synthetase